MARRLEDVLAPNAERIRLGMNQPALLALLEREIQTSSWAGHMTEEMQHLRANLSARNEEIAKLSHLLGLVHGTSQ